MKAMVLEAFRQSMVLRERDAPRPGTGEVLLQVKGNGLCGTDLKVHNGDVRSVQLPRIPGHEFSGVVVEVGSGVAGVQVGDQGVVHIYRTCGHCHYCSTARENMCPNSPGRYGFEIDGGFSDLCVVAARNFFRVAAQIPIEEAAILSGSISTPYHALRRGRVALGETVALFGMGGLGLHALQLTRALGARAIAIDIDAAKLERARELGADATINSRSDDPVAAIRRITDDGADVSVELIGGAAIPQVLEQAMNALRVGGRLVIVGYDYGQQFPIDPSNMVYRWIEVIGTRSSTRADLRNVISLVEAGRVRPIISSRFPLTEANAAFEQLGRSEGVGRILMV